jgi:uroporphyrin-III C-methyltransferase/precorrin-2 dehydrogenase/sirohydrochlorin ferrochelatase
MDYYPIFLKLNEQPCVVVGGGNVATRKIESLLEAGAQVNVIALRINPQITRWVMQGKIEYTNRGFLPSDLKDKTLVIAATDDSDLNHEVFNTAENLGVLANVTDDPDACRFIVPAVVDRSPLTIAISSGGRSPLLTRLLRQKLETLIPSAYGRLASFAGDLRQQVKDKLNSVSARRRFWETILEGPVAEKVLNGQEQSARHAFDQQLQLHSDTQAQVTGEVYLVGAGPGDPELVTLKALRLMQQADVVLYDNLVSKEVLDLVRRDAVKISVAKTKGNHKMKQPDINKELVRLAKEGKRVCRLKGGDSFIFGRGGEELEALVDANIPFQVVPGITAANGCAAYAGIPLTHRDYADNVTFITGHKRNADSEVLDKNDELNLPWANLINKRQTVVFYMGLSHLQEISKQLQIHGLSASTPAAAIEQGTSHKQRTVLSTIDHLAEDVAKAGLGSPTLIIVGEVVKLAEKLHWYGEAPLQTHRETVADPLESDLPIENTAHRAMYREFARLKGSI